MAEAYLKKLGGDKFNVKSAGLNPVVLNPFAIEVMKEDGIDISDNATQDVIEVVNNNGFFNYVITVCDEAANYCAPVLQGLNNRLSWSFEDPSQFTGTHKEKLEATRQLRDKIKQAVVSLVTQLEIQ